MKPRKTSKRIIGMLVGVTTGILAFIFVNEMLYPESIPENKKAIEIKQIADAMNDIAPMMINNTTRFDSVIVMPGNTVQYYYTLVNMYRDSVNLINFDNQYKPALVNNIKTNESLSFIRNYKLNVIYKYNDKNGDLLSTINITLDMYVY